MKTLRLAGLVGALTLVAAVVATAAAAAVPEADRLDSDSRDALQIFQNSSRKMHKLMEEAHGYAIFPSVGKGAVGIGAAGGEGQVYERGKLVGTAKLTEVTVGAQLGGQSYIELVLFETDKALDEFKDGKTAISAAVSAVVAGEGSAADAKYQHGVLVFTMARTGLMFEASVGGQHFKFMPISSASATPAPAATQAAPAGSAAPAPAPATPLPPTAPESQTPAP